MTIKYLKELNREEMQEIILKMTEIMSEDQCEKLEKMMEEYAGQICAVKEVSVVTRMSQEFVDEKMKQIKEWMRQIDEGELYLNTEGYEDYSSGYWDRDWITEYYDNQGIGDKITTIIRFAKDCVDDRKYKEAHALYEWLWEMSVITDEEYGESADLELLIEKEIVEEEANQLALLTLYVDYQVMEPDERAENIYLHFSQAAFHDLHIEDMLRVGREELNETEQFWKDWIELLKTKSGDTESRLLKEGVLYSKGVAGLVQLAGENYKTHPSLYLEVMKEYDKNHDYVQIEMAGKKAVENIDCNLTIRSDIAIKAAYAASYLGHTEEAMRFCWESFRSDSTIENFLRLYGNRVMAERYGIRAKEVLESRQQKSIQQGNFVINPRNTELNRNIIGDWLHRTLSFYTGDFSTVKAGVKNPKGSLGWSNSYIGTAIQLFLLYLYGNPLPSKAAAAVANTLGFSDSSVTDRTLDFEKEIIEECCKYKTSIFWNYFQRWKPYFPMEDAEKKRYLLWAEKIVYDRADAIVGGQHRRQYVDVAILLAMVAEIKEQMVETGAKREIFAVYKRKFPHHSSFQAEMKKYLVNT